MTLLQRTILIIISTSVALLFVMAVTSDVILLKSFAALERKVVDDDVQKVRNEIEETYDELLTSFNEFDSTVSASGFSSLGGLSVAMLENHKVDVVLCLDAGGRIISSLSADKLFIKHLVESENAAKSIKDAVALLRQKRADEPLNGVLVLGGKPVQLFMKALPDNTSFMMVGRYLDASEINRVTALTEFAIDLIPVSGVKNSADAADALAELSKRKGNAVQVLDQNRVAGFSMIRDVFDHPAFLIKIIEERVLYKQGKATIVYIIISMIVVGGAFCMVFLTFIRKGILNRLASLSGGIANISLKGSILERLPVTDSDDELNRLSVSVNSMLESLEAAEAELREGEARYRTLFERAPDSIIVIGLEGEEAGRIVAANQAAAEQHGYTLDEMLELSVSDLNTPETNLIAAEITSAVASGEWVNTELWHKKKDGSNFPIEVHAGLIKISGRKYVLGFDRDITQRKIVEETDHMHLEQIRRLNDELGRNAKDLEAANAELESFNYSVSHDMRGPLTRISGYCQLLLDDDCNTDPAVKEYVAKIYESGIWLNEMIESLLHLSQVTRVELVYVDVDLSAMAEEIVKELSLQNPERRVKVDIEPGIVVSGDYRLLKLVMVNLIGNSWKYTSKKDDASIEFAKVQTENGPAFCIRDNGAGFDMKNAGKLFHAFSRLHDSNEFIGTGVGLATVQRIIFRHAGRIWAKGEVGAGASFFFTVS